MRVDVRYFILLLILSNALSFYLHKDHISTDIQGIHSWRQSQTMWNIRNFVRHDSNILNPRVSHFNAGKDNIQRYEFPIMQWPIAQIQKVFGEKIEIVRICIFIIGMVSVFGIFYIARIQFKNDFTAFATAFLFQFSPVFYFYTINPIPDNLALAGAIWYLVFILRYKDTNKNTHLLLATSLLLLATLAKLPFLMFSIVSVFLFLKKLVTTKFLRKHLDFPLVHILVLSPAIIWYAWVMPTWSGNPILSGVFDSSLNLNQYQEILEYHSEVMFPELLLYRPVWILSIIGIIAMFYFRRNIGWLLSLAFITIIYFTLELNAIGTVHDYYMMPFLPWLFMLVGYGIFTLTKIPYYIGHILVLLSIIYAPIHTQNYTSDFWSLEKTYFNKDVFLNSEKLSKAVPDSAKVIILNDPSNYIFSYRIDKMGHIFSNDNLPTQWIGDMIMNHDVKYMYSDSRVVDQDSAAQTYIDSLLLKAGSVHVYKLKELGSN